MSGALPLSTPPQPQQLGAPPPLPLMCRCRGPQAEIYLDKKPVLKELGCCWPCFRILVQAFAHYIAQGLYKHTQQVQQTLKTTEAKKQTD